MKLMRKTRLKDWYEFYRTPCPICGHTGACMAHKNGDKVACIRVESDRYFSKNSALPSYLHFLKPKDIKKIDIEEVEEISSNQKLQDNELLDKIFRTLLNYLELSEKHYFHLTSERGLSDRQIMIRQYKSFPPEKPWKIIQWISEELGISDFTGVPGFYLKNQYWTIAGANGANAILIPFRNHYNQIIGFQYRIDNPPNVAEIKINRKGLRAVVKEQPDLVQVSFNGEVILEQPMKMKEWTTISHNGELLGWVRVKKGNRYFWLSSANKPNGTGPGNPAPIHVAVPSSQLTQWEVGTLHKAKTVWLTEGPLKADISADCIERLLGPHENIGTTLLALPGVGAWRLAVPILKEMGVETVNIAFDSDSISNPQVKHHLFECAKHLKSEGLTGKLVLWSETKGIDELLLLGKVPEIKKLF